MKRRVWFAASGLILLSALLGMLQCGPDWPEHEGELRQVVRANVEGLRRGAPGRLTLSSFAMYTPLGADQAVEYPFLGWTSTQLTLVGADKKSIPVPLARVGAREAAWETRGSSRTTLIQLPDVPDGDYALHVAYATVLGQGELDVPLALYSPTRIHVITDRPLYEPGNLMKFRAVVLRARDLAPLDGRPGRWIVSDASGEVMLEEEAPAGAFGVVAGSFPIDKSAAPGAWTVKWQSAGAQAEVSVRVEPFTLPRFRVLADTPRPFYRAGDAPVITGSVTYSSGAPVANAELKVSWNLQGEWRPPNDWLERLLPTQAVSGSDGRFELELPRVPGDLRGQVRMNAQIVASDAAKERVQGATMVLLSEDAIQAQVVTELGEELAQGFNNRMYVRVTTADGRPMPHASIKVQRSSPEDRGIEAKTDDDGVASLQIDPGPPLNIVIPPMPYRPPPAPPLVTRQRMHELFTGQSSLADQVEMERWLSPLAPCAKWVGLSNSSNATVGLRVSASGAIGAVVGDTGPLEHCVVGVLRQRRLPAGAERMYALRFAFEQPDLPSLAARHESVFDVPRELQDKVAELAASARDCLPRNVSRNLSEILTWRTIRGQRDVLLSWNADPQGGEAGSSLSCVKSRAGIRVQLSAGASEDSLGFIRFAAQPPRVHGQPSLQPTTRMGYELTITAELEGRSPMSRSPAESTASTKVIVAPGKIPDLRLRVSPVLTTAGASVTAELIRGPGFAEELPAELSLECLKHRATAKLDDERRAKLKIPRGVEGFCQISGAGARALVYVKPDAELRVSVASESARYAPGQQAKLQIKTSTGGHGGQAAVGLFGVDESLAQLATLPAPGDMSSVRPRVDTAAPAFGSLDGQALTQGRIRGEHAAAATILRVSAIPTTPELDVEVHARAETAFDAVAELTDRFYVILPELYAQARTWETSSKPSEKMKPATMAALWEKALAACEARKERVLDAYGRRLSLRLLPPDLLALTDPHVVVGGTRVPEDVENWAAWVRKEGR